jgi:hypothetical protein
MAERLAREEQTFFGLIRGLLQDVRDLIREELQLARAEIREEMLAAQSVVAAFAASAVAGLIGAGLLSIAIGGAIAYFLRLPTWAGYGIFAVILLVAAWALVHYGRSRLARIRAIPETTQTVKENMAWIQNRSVQK